MSKGIVKKDLGILGNLKDFEWIFSLCFYLLAIFLGYTKHRKLIGQKMENCGEDYNQGN